MTDNTVAAWAQYPLTRTSDIARLWHDLTACHQSPVPPPPNPPVGAPRALRWACSRCCGRRSSLPRASAPASPPPSSPPHRSWRALRAGGQAPRWHTGVACRGREGDQRLHPHGAQRMHDVRMSVLAHHTAGAAAQTSWPVRRTSWLGTKISCGRGMGPASTIASGLDLGRARMPI